MPTQQQVASQKLTHPILRAIFEDDDRVVAVKGDIGAEISQALHEVYAKKIDPASGYAMETIQQDSYIEAGIIEGVITQKELAEQNNKQYKLIYTVDPAVLEPVDLIDFKAAANELDADGKSDMGLYVMPTTVVNSPDSIQTMITTAQNMGIETLSNVEDIKRFLRG